MSGQSLLSSFRTKGLDARSKDGIFSVADGFNRGFSTTRRCNGRGQAAPMSATLSSPFRVGWHARNLLFSLGRDDGFDPAQWIIVARWFTAPERAEG